MHLAAGYGRVEVSVAVFLPDATGELLRCQLVRRFDLRSFETYPTSYAFIDGWRVFRPEPPVVCSVKNLVENDTLSSFFRTLGVRV
jgi:hypothetical protein